MDHIKAYREADNYDSYIENLAEQVGRNLTVGEREDAWNMYCELEHKYKS